jgi:hypothetical protein
MDQTNSDTNLSPDCDPHDGHSHVHGDDCGHEKVQHGEHVDYVHEEHRHAQHEEHWDEHPADQPVMAGTGAGGMG